MTSRNWTCPTCGAEYTLAPAGTPQEPRTPGWEQNWDDRLTDAQGKALYALGQELPGKKQELLGIIKIDYGRDSIDDLTKAEASKLISRLQIESRRRR